MKKRKILGRKLLGFLLTLAMVVGLMPGMSLTALAAWEGDPYASLLNTTTVVKFDNKDWYLIENNSTAANAGTVTLLAKECVEKSAYYNIDWTFVPYDNSTIKGVVDTWYSKHITENAKTAVNGNGMFLLTTEQANKINKEVRKCPKYSEEMGNYHWWLCSRSSDSDMFNYCAAFVDGADGYVDGDGANTLDEFGVRPALKLNLESVTFSSVNLSGGANATISEGTATQSYFDVGNTRGAMTQVTYTANANYKFPETSELYKTTNGITVTRTSDTEITVSGAPTATVTSIAVPDAVLAHTHSFTYSFDGATITATCSAEGCPLTDKKATLTIGAPLHTTYGDSNNVEAVITDENSIKGSATVSYYKATKSGSDYTKTGEALASAPTDAGDYVAEITLGTEESNKATASVGYTIAKANPTVTPPTAAATYGQTLGEVPLSNPNGNLAGTWEWTDTTSSVGNAGVNTFQASFTPTDTNNYNTLTDVEVTVTVSKAQATISEQTLIDANKPTEKTQSELYYTGNSIELVNAPSELPDDYSIQYSTDNGTTWSAAIPTRTDPGNYTVNVKYVNTSGNYEDVELSNGISVIITVDSSVLNTVIGEATTYHTEISDKNETNIYDTVLSTLNDAITRANNVYEDSNSTDEQVAEAISSLNTALKQAKESVKHIDDQNAFAAYKAEQKTEAGNKAQTGDSTVVQGLITTAQENIDSLAYDDTKTLEENKAAVDAIITQLATDLTDQRAADAVIKKIDAISDNMTGTNAEKQAIQDALDAYNKLTENQKDKISGENKTKLAGAEGKWVDAYKTAQKNDAGALVSDADSEAAKTLVTNAQNDIHNITYDQSKGLDVFKAAVDAIITKLKADVADQRAAEAVIKQIKALRLADEVTIDDKNAIEAARAAYNALTDGQKLKVSAEILKKLTDAEAALKELVDAAEAKKVADKIDKLPSSDKVALTDKESIEAARKAYDALTDDQKEKINPETLKKLTDAEDKLAILQAMSEVSAKTGSDMTYTGNPIQLINTPTTKLPAGYKMVYAVTTENKAPTDEKLYTTEIPAKTDAKTYYVWYMAKGDGLAHTDSDPVCITVTISNSAPSGGGGSASEGTSPTTPTTPTQETYTVSIENESSLSVATEITDGNAKVSEITGEQIQKITANSEEIGGSVSASNTITIDVSGATQEVNSVELTKGTVERLADTAMSNNSVDTVTIQMTNATVEMDAKTLEAVSQQATEDEIRLVVEDTQHVKLTAEQQSSIRQYTSAATFEAYFISGGTRIGNFKGGVAKVSVKYTLQAGSSRNFLHMIYLSVMGGTEYFPSRYFVDAKGYGWVQGDLTHFSDYAIVYDENKLNQDGELAMDPYSGLNQEAFDPDKSDFVEDDATVLANGKTAYQNGISLNSGLKLYQKGSTLGVTWGKVAGADGYRIYAAYCGSRMPAKPIKVTKNTKYTIKKLNGKKLNLKKNYKVYVVAYKTVDGVDKVLGRTVTAHVVGRKNAKFSNPKKLTITSKTKVSLKTGKTTKVKAKVTLVSPKRKSLSDGHAPLLRFASSNKKVVTVDKTGKVKGIGKGTCVIYVYAKNGYTKKVKITVK